MCRSRTLHNRAVTVGQAPPAGLRFHVLGPLRATRGGVEVDLGPPKQRALLAALLLAEGKVVSADRLVEALWGEEPPTRAAANVQVYVSKMRRLLHDNGSEQLVRRPPGYALTAGWVDVTEFRRLALLAAEHLQAGSWAGAVDAAAAGVGLWRGPFLEDLADEPWVSSWAAGLDETYGECVEGWVTGLLGLGRIGEAVSRSQTLVEAYPLREHSWWLRMIALHRAGRSPEALEAFQHFAGDLDEQLGLEPGPELRALQTAILRHDEAIASWPERSAEHSTQSRLFHPDSTQTDPEHPVATPPAIASAGRRGLLIVGRDEQLTVLDAVLDDLVAGRDRWVSLTGRAGMGKTRLAVETAARARVRGVRTLWTSCPDDAGTPAWWPLRALVAALGASPEEMFIPPVGVDADTLRFLIYERFTLLLQQAATERPLLVVIDDAQWLDTTSMRWLTFLAHTKRLPRVGILLTVRDRELRAEFKDVLAAIGRVESSTHLAVEPLDGPSASQLLRQIAGDTITAADAFALMQRIGGNPLLLTEYARLPAQERRDGEIPSAARTLLERRLRRLPEDVLTVLRAAAVIGDVFALDLLAAVTALDLPTLLDRLDAAVADAIIGPASSGTGYQFSHGLLRDAVLAELTVLRRQALHARIGALLPEGGKDAQTLIRRAHHLSAAMAIVGPHLVVDACSVAARAAEHTWDWEAAAQQWDAASAAQQLVPDTGRDERDALLIHRLNCLVRSGRPLDTLDLVAAAVDTAAAGHETASIGRLAAVLLRTAGTWGLGADRPALMARLQAALPSRADDPAAHVRVLAVLAVGNHYHLDPDVPDRLSRAALDIAEQYGDPDVLADALVGRLVTYAGSAAHAAEAKRLLDRLAALPHQLEEADQLLRHNISTMVAFQLGDIQGATDHMRQTIRIADTSRIPVDRVHMRWFASTLALWRGEFDLAEQLAARALELHLQTDSWGADLYRVGTAVALLWQRGRLAENPQLLAQAFSSLAWQALAAAETGHHPRGRQLLSDHLAAARSTPWFALPSWTLTALAAAELEDADAARQALDAFTDQQFTVLTIGYACPIGPITLITGRLRALLGDRDGARTDFALAEQVASRSNGQPALLRIGLARLELDPPSPGRTEALYDLARAADNLHMTGLAAAARSAARPE